jgi:hypothetical protein
MSSFAFTGFDGPAPFDAPAPFATFDGLATLDGLAFDGLAFDGLAFGPTVFVDLVAFGELAFDVFTVFDVLCAFPPLTLADLAAFTARVGFAAFAFTAVFFVFATATSQGSSFLTAEPSPSPFRQ